MFSNCGFRSITQARTEFLLLSGHFLIIISREWLEIFSVYAWTVIFAKVNMIRPMIWPMISGRFQD